MSDDTEERPTTDAAETDQATDDVSLLELPERKAAKRVFDEWDRQTPLLRMRHEVWRVNALRRRGFTNVFIRKNEDTGVWAAYAPPDARPNPVHMNKAGRLCERFVATLFADPPVPEATPDADTDKAREAAEFGTRRLIEYGREAELNTPLKAQKAGDVACTYDSGFVRYLVDPRGNGLRKMTVLAHPEAATLQQAVRGPDGTPYPRSELVTRFVMPDQQTLTDDPKEAGEQPLPKLRSEVLNALHVRFLPNTAQDIWEAEAVMVAALIPLGRLRSAFKDALDALTEDELKELVTKHPEGVEALLPIQARRRFRADIERGRVNDASLVFTITYYQIVNGSNYPKGAYLCVAGDKEHPLLLARHEWVNPETGKPLDIPVSQFKQWDLENDTWGVGVMGKLGPGNEARAYLQGAQFEQVDRTLNRKVFYPITSTYQPKAAQAQLGTHIPINPGGAPTYEEVPELPQAVKELYADITAEMDDEVGLQLPAQGINPPSVKSGLHAQQLIEQTKVGLSGPVNNTTRALLRCWRIELQLTRAFFPVEQRMSWQNDDGIYKARSWTGADLGDTEDVQLAKGSFTQLAPSQKMAVAEHAAALQIIGPDELKRIMIGNVGGLIGLQDDPQRDRIRRQLDAWLEGPPAEVREQQTQWELEVRTLLQADPNAQPTTPPPVQVYGQRIFVPLPSDVEMDVARVRHAELRRTIASTKFTRWPQPWQAVLLAEYERMRQAAGVMTLAEQQQAAAAAQQPPAAPAAAPTSRSAAAPAPQGSPAVAPPASPGGDQSPPAGGDQPTIQGLLQVLAQFAAAGRTGTGDQPPITVAPPAGPSGDVQLLRDASGLRIARVVVSRSYEPQYDEAGQFAGLREVRV